MTTESQISALLSEVFAPLPAGSRVRLVSIKGAPRVQQRVEGAERGQELIDEARRIRAEDGTPFWHALFLAGEASPGGVPIEIVQSALFHQEPEESGSHEIVIGGSTVDEVARIVVTMKEEGTRDSLALESRVALPDGEIKYIPMLDFSVKSKRPGGEKTAIASVRAIGEPGALFASARSYHFYGQRLLTADEQVNFWAKALLLTPIVDERWIAHQLRAGRAALRISANEYGLVPTLVSEARPLRAASS